MPNVTCHDLIREGLPDLVCSEEFLRTKKPSLPSHHVFKGSVLDWPNFDQEVETFINQPNHQPNDTTVLFQRPSPPPGQAQRPAHFEKETYICGEEKGVEGRFNANVMHLLEHAALLHNLNVRLGDFKCTTKGQGDAKQYPDMACMTRFGVLPHKQEPRFVGECKTDWEFKILEDHQSTNSKRLRIRRWIKQIASYLRQFELRYGFITTYHFTIFVHFPHFTHSEPAVTDTLYISDPIPNHQAYQAGHKVSVRQVIWFFMLKANQGADGWQMTKDQGVKIDTGLRSADKDPKAGRSDRPPLLGDSQSASDNQPLTGSSAGDTYVKEVKVLAQGHLEKLPSHSLQIGKNKDGAMIWELRKDNDKPQKVECQHVKLYRDSEQKPVFIVCLGEKPVCRLQIQGIVKAKMMQCRSNNDLQAVLKKCLQDSNSQRPTEKPHDNRHPQEAIRSNQQKPVEKPRDNRLPQETKRGNQQKPTETPGYKKPPQKAMSNPTSRQSGLAVSSHQQQLPGSSK